jgi:hypothetical protein
MKGEEYVWGSTGSESEKRDHLFLEQFFKKFYLSDFLVIRQFMA